MKIHIKENGYALIFVVENVSDRFHSELVHTMEDWAGNAGNVGILSEEEVARQVVNDVVLKRSKRAQADSPGNFDAMTSLLIKCVELRKVNSPNNSGALDSWS